MRKYAEGIYRIIHDPRGWCVAKLQSRHADGTPLWHRVSKFYRYRGWAQAFSRWMKIPVQNYESNYA